MVIAMHEPSPSVRAALVAGPRDLVGRGDALELIRDAFAAGRRLVVLVGAGGVGKTRLALHHVLHARTHAGLDTSDAAVCELTGCVSAADVCLAVSRGLGLSMDPSDDASRLVEAVGAALAQRGDVLVVLDEADRVVRHAAETVGRWVSAAPSARFLVTSRERLRLPGELDVEVSPLGLPRTGDGIDTIARSEAVELFVARAKAARPSFVWNADVARDVAAIVRRVDGLPLAIELCAARVALLAPRQLLDRLSLHVDGTRSEDGLARTLSGTLEWSWELLEPVERRTLARCALFRGGFDLELAAAVCELDATSTRSDATLAVLQRLYDKSLLVPHQPAGLPDRVRYRLLEVVREHAEGKLPSTCDEAAANERHARAVLARGDELLAALDESPVPETWRRLFVETDNLAAVCARALDDACAARRAKRDAHADEAVRRAMRALLALEPAMTARGPLDAFVTLAEAALSGARERDAGDPILVARLRLALATVEMARGRFDAAVPQLEAAAGAARRGGAPSVEVLVWVKLGALTSTAAPADGGDAFFDRARRLLQEQSDPRVEGILHADLASSLAGSGREDEVIEHRRRAVELLRRARDLPRVGYALGALASALLGVGRAREAERCCREALGILRSIDNGRIESRVLAILARVQQERGELAAAKESLRDALSIDRRLGATWYEPQHLGMLADVELEAGDAVEAAALCSRAIELLAHTRDPITEAALQGRRAAAEALLDRAAAAQELLECASRTARSAGAPGRDASAIVGIFGGQIDVARARANIVSGDPRAAARDLEAARARLATAGATIAGSGRSLLERSHEARVAARLLQKAIEAASPATIENVAPNRSGLLVVGPDTSWFEYGGERVSLLRRHASRRILARLVERRLASPGYASTVADLFAAGWGQERIRRDAMANRVYVALAKLRALGLRGAIQSREDGFSIPADVRVLTSDASDRA